MYRPKAAQTFNPRFQTSCLNELTFNPEIDNYWPQLRCFVPHPFNLKVKNLNFCSHSGAITPEKRVLDAFSAVIVYTITGLLVIGIVNFYAFSKMCSELVVVF